MMSIYFANSFFHSFIPPLTQANFTTFFKPGTMLAQEEDT